MHLLNYVKAGIVIALVSGMPRAQAQTLDSLGRPQKLAYPSPAFDSLGRPRPLSHQMLVHSSSISICEGCIHETRHGKQPAFRVIGTDRDLLFMSSAESLLDSTADRHETPLADLDASLIDSVRVVKGAAAAAAYGDPYAAGVVVVVLNQKGTDAWRKAAIERATKLLSQPSLRPANRDHVLDIPGGSITI